MNFPSDWTREEVTRWQAVAEQCATEQRSGRVVVLATGVFDLFHEEHQKFLQRAKEAGDFLVVGLETDSRVRSLKGSGRPVHNERKRVEQVQNFPAVDQAVLLPEQFSRPEHHRSLIALLQPDILAVSSHSPYQDKKQAILEEFGGTLKVVHEHNPSVSTTKILDQRT